MMVSDPPTQAEVQAEVQAIANKVDQLLAALLTTVRATAMKRVDADYVEE